MRSICPASGSTIPAALSGAGIHVNLAAGLSKKVGPAYLYKDEIGDVRLTGAIPLNGAGDF